MSNSYAQPASVNRTPFYTGIAVAILVVAVIAAAGYRFLARGALHAETVDAAIPTVSIVRPTAGPGGVLTLPGRLQPFADAPVFARTNGYLKKWYVDIGAKVKAGQVLADIEAPDLDQQLVAARAALATAEANRALAAQTEVRWDNLMQQNAVSRQAYDEKKGDLAAKVALRNQAAATSSQLQAEVGFKHIVAPFDGIVTTRATDVGSLIVAGTTAPIPLFTISDTSRLRLYVNVPQSNVAVLQPGTKISFTVPEHPGQIFTAVLATTANAIDPQTGAMLLQFEIDNADGILKAGGYADVSLAVPQASATVHIPPSALLFRKEGTAVAVVGRDNVVAIRPVKIVSDLGSQLEISSGLGSSDRIVDSPADGIQAGDKVRVND